MSRSSSYLRIFSLVLLASMVQACGKSTDSRNKALPDVMAPADSPDLQFSTRNLVDPSGTKVKLEPVVTSPRVSEESALALRALKFTQALKIPLFADFPSLVSVPKGKADWFVGSRCKLLLADMAKAKSAEPNLLKLVDPQICSNSLIGAKSEIILVPSRYIGRRFSNSSVLLTESNSVDVVLRKDLTVGAYRETRSVGKRDSSKTIVAKDGFVVESIQETNNEGRKTTSELRVTSYGAPSKSKAKGNLKYVARSSVQPVSGISRTVRELTHDDFEGHRILVREIVELSGFSERCLIRVYDKSNREISALQIPKRCLHQAL